jgi:hypothetical protein
MKINLQQYRNHKKGYAYFIRLAIYCIILVVVIWFIRHQFSKYDIEVEEVEEGIEVFL